MPSTQLAERTPLPGPPMSRARLVIMIGSLSAFGALSIDMYLPALPSLTVELHGTPSSVQLTLTACLLGLAAGQLISGPLSDSIGRRRPLLVGLLLYVLASLACALAPSVPALIVLRLLQGLAGAAGGVIGRAIARDLYSGVAVARFFSLTVLVNGLAPILAPIIGGQLLTFTTWRGVFVVLAGIGAVLFLAAALGLRETLPVERRRARGLGPVLTVFRVVLKDRIFVGYSLAAGFAFAAMFAYIAGSPFVLEGIYGASPQLFSVIFACNALGIVVMAQVSGQLVGRAGPRRLLVVGLTSSLAGGLVLLASVVFGVGLVGVLPGLFLVVSSIGWIAPNATALALEDYHRTAGTASALLGVLQTVVGATVAPLVGIGGEGTALPMAIVIAVLGVAASLTFLLLARRPAHTRAAPA